MTTFRTGSLGSAYLAQIFGRHYHVATPTQCCRCCKVCSHGTVFLISVCIVSFFFILLPNLIPTMISVYYLYPTRTLARLINSALYINSLTALLLFQCEKCWYACVRRYRSLREEQNSKFLMDCYILKGLRLLINTMNHSVTRNSSK